MLHGAATAGLVLAILGGILVFAIPCGLWSDVPGWILLVVGATTEFVLTVAVVLRRLAGGR